MIFLDPLIHHPTPAVEVVQQLGDRELASIILYPPVRGGSWTFKLSTPTGVIEISESGCSPAVALLQTLSQTEIPKPHIVGYSPLIGPPHAMGYDQPVYRIRAFGYSHSQMISYEFQIYEGELSESLDRFVVDAPACAME